jgi:hypothetical protein
MAQSGLPKSRRVPLGRILSPRVSFRIRGISRICARIAAAIGERDLFLETPSAPEILE